MADIVTRAQVSQEINDRFMEQIATCSHEKPMRELFKTINCPKKKEGRRIRALDPIGKDCALLQAISDPDLVSPVSQTKRYEKNFKASMVTTGAPKNNFPQN